ncbi:MAG: carbon storage regulator [Melioribacteraceae bacterium]|nr:carbon storage regulator [Melioribacteraceae bacterium]WKZ70140.1 MAG: carbon storage regulator [Melioribacteraceae bacterium]
MLVLNRKPGEEIRIGSDILIKIISSADGNVKIGIDAPQDVAILRGELYQNVKESVIKASEESYKPLTEAKSLTINKLRDTDNE